MDFVKFVEVFIDAFFWLTESIKGSIVFLFVSVAATIFYYETVNNINKPHDLLAASSAPIFLGFAYSLWAITGVIFLIHLIRKFALKSF